ncbi:UNKNOWN [Stylonychia lemnae]|uniref:Uncharacterized protein n=1 Tax=Stylonychia lemnae TaxID=5949 RepID=A0A077ZTM8_STYLE|nr:UNKNOWN [Stylonychia lemnae]|eukprot:CDW73252.1 UNKNOWN [Stylonychia lemnae]
MGFPNFRETDVLMRIHEGVYTSPKKPSMRPQNFDKNQRMLIYDNTNYFLEDKPGFLLNILTFTSMAATFHMGFYLALPFYYWITPSIISGIGSFLLVSAWYEKSISIAQIHLIQNEKNFEFTDNAAIVLANGKEIQCKISELKLIDHDESNVKLSIKENKKIFILSVDPENQSQYINLQFTFAALNIHTQGIFICENPKRLKQTEQKK